MKKYRCGKREAFDEMGATREAFLFLGLLILVPEYFSTCLGATHKMTQEAFSAVLDFFESFYVSHLFWLGLHPLGAKRVLLAKRFSIAKRVSLAKRFSLAK